MAIVTLLWYFGALCLVQCSVSRGDELKTISIPVEDASHCKDTDSCADNTPGTGHVLFEELTDAVWAVEQCYSFCLANTSQDEQLSGAVDFYDDSGDKCLDLQESYICLSACLYVKTAAVQAVNISMGSSLSLQGNPSCSDLCSTENGLCERAFSPTANSDCVTNCKNGDRCAHFCEIARNMEVNSNTIELPADLNGTLTLSLSPSDKDNGFLYKQGVMEINNTAGVPSDQYGIVWRVTGENEEYYIPQHFPFILLPGEVGTLYRTGANLLAIQQFQCRQNLNLSYALVSSAGRTDFSQPLPQCFQGNGFPHPPSGIHVSFGFEEMSSNLRIEVTVDHLSPDHSTVTAYGVQVYDATDSQLTTRVLFPDRENLTLVLVGEDAENTFPPTNRPISYLIGVYALPQPNISISGRMLIPTSNWVFAKVEFPSFPQLNGTICYTATLNRTSNTSHFAFRYTVHSGWRSLAPVSELRGKLTQNVARMIPGFGPIYIPNLFYPDSTLKTEVNNFTYVFEFEDVDMPVGDRYSFRFYIQTISLYAQIPIRLTGESEVNFNPIVYTQNEDRFTTCPVLSFPQLNGTICYTATLNRTSNTSHFAFRYTVHSGWRSLAPVSELRGKLTQNVARMIPGFGPIYIPSLFYPDSTLKSEVNNFTYVFEFEDVDMPVGDGYNFRFYIQTISLYAQIPIRLTGESEVLFKPIVYAQNEDRFTTCPVVTTSTPVVNGNETTTVTSNGTMNETGNGTANENGTRDSAANKALLSIVTYFFILVSIFIN